METYTCDKCQKPSLKADECAFLIVDTNKTGKDSFQLCLDCYEKAKPMIYHGFVKKED